MLYFYPKDFTPGCTKEACDFRDNYSAVSRKAVILGVSTDSVSSHKKFKEFHKLPFTLLSDENKKVVKTYGVWKKKKFLGKEYMGIERTTFIIGGNGKIVKIFPKVKVENHWKEVLDGL